MHSNTTFVLVGAGLAVGSAHGQILRTDFNITYDAFDNIGTQIDVNADGTNDFVWATSPSNAPSQFWDLNFINNAGELFTRSNPGVGATSLEVGDVIGTTPSAGVDAPGSALWNNIIGAVEASQDSDAYKDGLYGNAVDPAAGGFAALGFGIDDGFGGTQYGALYFDATPIVDAAGLFDAEITLLYAEVETSGGDYTVVPAPSALAVLAMGGVAAGRRKRRSA